MQLVPLIQGPRQISQANQGLGFGVLDALGLKSRLEQHAAPNDCDLGPLRAYLHVGLQARTRQPPDQ